MEDYPIPKVLDGVAETEEWRPVRARMRLSGIALAVTVKKNAASPCT